MIRALIILFYLFATVIVGALGDGLNASGTQDWGHVANAIEVGVLLIAFYAIDEDRQLTAREVFLMFGTYVCLRFAFFDYAYNIFAGNELTYLSHNNFWGRLWIEFLKAEPQGIVWARLVFLIVGVLLPLKYLKK